MNETTASAPVLPPVLSVLPSRGALEVLNEVAQAKAANANSGEPLVVLGDVAHMSFEEFDDLVAVAAYRARKAAGNTTSPYTLAEARMILGLPPR